jgi:hypothetical protein
MLPFNPDARLLAVLWPLYVIAAALVAGLALRGFVGRWLLEGDPRRQLIAQVILYAGASPSSRCRCGCGTAGGDVRRQLRDNDHSPHRPWVITRTSWASRESLLVDGLVPRESSTMTRAKLLLRATK